MSMDLTGITNKNEYYTNHYFSTVFEENTRATISGWNAAARESEEIKTPWSLLRQNARQYYTAHDKFVRSSVNLQVLANIKALVGNYLKSLGYPEAKPEVVAVDDSLSVPVYLEMTKSNGAPLLWVLLSASKESDAGIMESFVFNANDVDDDAAGTLYKGVLGEIANEDLVTKILFGTAEPPRFVMLIGMNQIALIDRNKWNEKRYLQFELEEIFSRLENTTLQAMSVLLHKDSLCPDDGKVLLDELDEQSQKNASGVSQDLKYALRESIELLGNEVLYDMKARLGRDLDADPVDAGQLTLECLRYMYRMLFVLFIESRPELGYAPIKAQSYYSGYSLEREHTGLLERPDREQLEIDFKRSKDTQEIWDPNVLSCTPTLEMGIDIGDLSTVILCSMPPAQSQFLQRAGRAGRKDGNALTLAIANARPHDLYFYSDPLDMIAGEVTPPKIFLRASAVLERQFVAFCMDSWVKKGIPDGAIPDKVGIVLKKLDARPDDMFPFNFLNYVQSTLSRQLNSFMQMFAAYLDDSAREELQMFARGKDATSCHYAPSEGPGI